MAKRHRYPGQPAFGYQPGHPYQNYGPYGENNYNFMPPIYGPNYPVDQPSYYYPPPQQVPPHYHQPWPPNQHYSVQPPYYAPPGQYMPGQQQYYPQFYNPQPGHNQSRRHRPEAAPYYAQARPQPIAQPPEPPSHQVNPETYPAPLKKAGKNHAPRSRQYAQPHESASEAQVHPEPLQTSTGQPAPGSNKPNYKNWQNYKGKKQA